MQEAKINRGNERGWEEMNEKLRQCLYKRRGVWASKRLVYCKAKDACENRFPDQNGRFCKLSPIYEDMETRIAEAKTKIGEKKNGK